MIDVEYRGGGIAIITLLDPERRNAMTVEMGEAIASTCDALRERPDLRVAIITGSPPAFSAGGDLGMLEEHARKGRENDVDATDGMLAFYERFLAVRSLEVPVIAAINGHAVGAGLCLALACDIRIAASDAKLGLNFARLGLHPGMGGSWFLPRLLGEQNAAVWLYTGKLFSGDEAAHQGLVYASVPADQVLDEALALATEIAANGPLVVRQLKTSLRLTGTHDLADHLLHEATNQSLNYRTADLAEGLRAVRDRREPQFTGR